ncbi:PREDICTED: obscurin-like protein 1, partial [Pterocles gutturalis]|uniref:obscurin-like protein 1 n=1 Tax=Pterocles gutturalis TaxID=240206 RepID=UPI000528857E
FRCYITGKPKPEIIWQKDGEPLIPGRRHLIYEDREGYFILKVLYCKPQDQGLYVCAASNTAGQTLSAVQLRVKEHRLRFQVQLADVEVAELEDAVLECQVPLETIPTAWYLEDRELQPSHKYVMEEQGVLRRLTIRNARTDDDGIYLCQMKDKGRSIAEVSVRGVITKRLPRKLDVMEGENAVFCVETREAVEGICWSRDGLQLQESPHTVLKSFGRTHLLVLVHVTRQDAGIIAFTVGESQTSSQLRVKSAVHGAWFLDGAKLDEGEAGGRCSMQRRGTEHSLLIRGVRLADSRTQVTFVSGGVRDSATLHVEAPQVHISPVPEAERFCEVLAGLPVLLECQVTPPDAPVRWLKDGEAVPLDDVIAVQEEGCVRRLLLRSAGPSDTGTYTCDAGNDAVSFVVTVTEAPVRIISSNEEVPHAYAAGQRVELWCQLSRTAAQVRWYKDGEEVEASENLVLEQEGPRCRLVLPCAQLQDAGEFVCDAGGDSVFYTVTVAEAPVRIVSSNEEAPHAYTAGQRVELWCQLSRTAALVRWYKDGEEVEASENLVLEQEGL